MFQKTNLAEDALQNLNRPPLETNNLLPEPRPLWKHEFASGWMDPDFEEELLDLQLDPDRAWAVIAQFWHDLAGKLGIAPMRAHYWEELSSVYGWPALMAAMTELWATLDPLQPADHIRDYLELLPKWQARFQALAAQCQAARFLPQEASEMSEPTKTFLTNPLAHKAA